MKWVLGLVWVVIVARPAIGQAVPVPDSATVEGYRQLLFGLSDTIRVVSARGNEFRRDLKTVGETTILARAERLAAACAGVGTAVGDARAQLAAAPLAARVRGARDTLVTAMGALASALERDCRRGLGPTGPGVRADTLRAWGPNRTARLDQAVRGYHGAAARFARRLGIDLSAR